MGTLRKTWLWVSTAALIVACGVAATVWLVQHNSQTVAASPEDCAIVKNTTQQWQETMKDISNELLTGTGERDWLAVAERQSTMSDKLRATADSVSTPAIKDELSKWADATALSAQLQRDSANRPPGVETPPNDEAALEDAVTTIDDATSALNEACSGMLPPLEGN